MRWVDDRGYEVSVGFYSRDSSTEDDVDLPWICSVVGIVDTIYAVAGNAAVFVEGELASDGIAFWEAEVGWGVDRWGGRIEGD